MPNLFVEYCKKKRLEELQLINNKITSYKKLNKKQNTKYCKNKQIPNYNCNTKIECDRSFVTNDVKKECYIPLNRPIMTHCLKKEYILNEYRNCYRKLTSSSINANIKQCIVFNDCSRTLLYVNKSNLKIFISYSKKYGLYIYVKLPDVDLVEHQNEANLSLLKKLEELTNVNLELEEKQKKLLQYIKKLQSGIHFIAKGEEEPLSCSRLDFM